MEMCDGTVSAFIIPISQNRKEACGYELAYQGHKAQEGLSRDVKQPIQWGLFPLPNTQEGQ